MAQQITSTADGQFVFEAVVAGRRVTVRIERTALEGMVRELEETPVARTEGLRNAEESRTISAPGISLKVSGHARKPWLTTSFSLRKS